VAYKKGENLSISNPVSQKPTHTKNRLTLILLAWKIWWASNNASEWQVGFGSAFEGLTFREKGFLTEQVKKKFIY